MNVILLKRLHERDGVSLCDSMNSKSLANLLESLVQIKEFRLLLDSMNGDLLERIITERDVGLICNESRFFTKLIASFKSIVRIL